MGALVRGRLPARVYWTRRLLVVATALGLVVGIAHLLSTGSDASSGPAQARQAAATTGQATGRATGQATGATAPSPHRRRSPAPARTSWSPPTPAVPEGPCAASDITVTPTPETTVAGSDVRFALALQTRTSPACTWHVSHRTLTLKITSGLDDIWSSLQCPGVVPDQEVVVRQAQPTVVRVTWNARRADTGCAEGTWARPGTYHLAVAAFSGEPTDTRFTLTLPVAGTIVKTRQPSPVPTFGHR